MEMNHFLESVVVSAMGWLVAHGVLWLMRKLRDVLMDDELSDRLAALERANEAEIDEAKLIEILSRAAGSAAGIAAETRAVVGEQ